MNVTKEQSMAYTEVIEVLKHMEEIEVNKIPKEIINYYQENRDISYDFKIDAEKSFQEQTLLEQTKVILAILFRDYWATEEQKEKIKQKEKYDLNKIEEEKKERYSTDNLFKRKQEVEPEKALIEYKKENWHNKFIEFMRKFFKRKKNSK